MDITFLKAAVPLQKIFYKENNKIQATSYPMVKKFTTFTYEVEGGLEELTSLIQYHAEQGDCLLKGTVSRELAHEPRAGITPPNTLTRWICLDMDGVHITSIKVLLTRMGLYEYSHIIQYSSKAGVIPEAGISAHVFFMLEEETLPANLKTWLRYWNLTYDKLSDQIRLTRDKNQLRWPLDVTVCQNDKLIYITPPKCQGITDSFEGERVTLVKRKHGLVPLSKLGLDRINVNDVNDLQKAKANELRKAEGLEERDFKTKIYKSETVIASPDAAIITGLKEERGFTYLNLNGGDSWAYYHAANNPHIIRNFKGEDAFATKDLLPDYYETAKERAKEYDQEQKAETEKRTLEQNRQNYKESLEQSAQQAEGDSYFVANDRSTDSYYTIEYDHENDRLEINKTGARQKLLDFMAEHGQPEPTFIPNWNFVFDFADPAAFKPDQQWVNIYRQTELLRDAAAYLDKLQQSSGRRITKPPTLCDRVIRHALGGDEQVIQDFYNWLAFLLQRREPPRSAWILQGRQGTGKGVLFNKIIKPIIGPDYCTPTSIQALETQYNGWLKHSLVVMVDESSTDSVSNEADVLEKMKVYIKEDTVQLRAMRTDHKQTPLYASFIINSNKKNRAWKLEETDRRYHVAPYQEEFLDLSDEDIEKIKPELPQLLKFLMEFEVDEKVARTPRETEYRELMKHVSRTALDSVAKAIIEGDMAFFLDYAPQHVKQMLNDPFKGTETLAYTQFVEGAIEWDEGAKRTPYKIHRDMLRIVLNYLVGNIPESPNKFTSMMKHHDIMVKSMKVDGVQGQGIEMSPKVTKAFIEEWRTYIDGPQAEKINKAAKVVTMKPASRRRTK